MHPQAELAVLSEIVAHESLSAALCSRVCQAIADEDVDEGRAVVAELLRSAPERLQLSLALKLAEQSGNAEMLLALLERGTGSVRLLQNATLVEKLRLAAPPRASERIDALTVSLPPKSEAMEKLVAQRQRGFSVLGASVD